MNLKQNKNLYLTLGLLISVVILPSIGYALDHFVENDPSAVPTYYWTAGCTPTSTAMMLGYYDWPRKSGGSTHQYGKLVEFYEERKNASRHQAAGGGNYKYDTGSGDSAGNDTIPNRIYTLAYQMGTDKDGGTPLKDIFGNPLTNNVKDAIEYVANTLCGYSFTAFQDYTESDWNMIWEKIKVEIDNNRPCVWGSDTPQMSGGLYAHAVCAIGYSDEGLIYFRNTWQPGYDSCYYDNFQTYSRIVGVTPGGGMWSDVKLTSPAGGESWVGGTIQQITWFNYYSLTPITHAKLLYSVDGGHSWEDIVDTNTAGGSGSYSWRVPKDLDSTNALLRIEAYAGDAYVAGDGTEARFNFEASDANGAQAAIGHQYSYNTEGDVISGGSVLMKEIWKWWVTNLIDIGEDVKNIKLTANCPYSLTWGYQRPSSANPPIYVWEYGVDIPEDKFFNAQGEIDPGAVLSLPVRMTRQVSPEILEDPVTIQTINAELVFTSLPPQHAAVYIGIPKDVLYERLITTEIISQNDLPKWRKNISCGMANWGINHNDIELNTPYRFVAQVRATKSPRIAGNPIWKPHVSVVMGNWVQVSPPPPGSSFTLSHPDGVTVTFEAAGKIGWEPCLDAGGKSGGMQEVMSEVPIAPLLDPIGGKVVSEEETLTFTVTATDPNTGDHLTYSASNLPLGANFDPDTHTFSWTPTYIQAGTYTNVHFVVTDSAHLSDSEDITITVNNVDVPIPLEPEIDVLGNGISIPSGDTTPSAEDNTDFGSVDVDNGSVTHEFTIQNTGGVNLVITGDPKVRINSTKFTVITQPVSPIPASGSSTFQIKFEPTSSGTHTATVCIYNNDSDESTYTFTIQGQSRDFAFDPPPNPSSQTITQGNSTSYTVSLKSIGGYDSPVSLVVNNISPWPGSGNPISCTISPSTLTPQDPPANATLNVTTASYVVPQTYTIQIRGTDGAKTKYTSVQLVITPSSLNGTITGYVYQSDGTTPISNINVSVDIVGGEGGYGTMTTSSGYYFLSVPAGNYKVHAGGHDGYVIEYYNEKPYWDQADVVTVTEGGPLSDINFTLDPGATISGHVYKQSDGTTPIANENISVELASSEYGRESYGARTDTAGYYSIVVPYGQWKVRAGGNTIYALEYYLNKTSRATADIVTVSATQNAPDINFTLVLGGTVSGKITDASGTPISGVEIRYWNDGKDAGRNAYSNSDGTYLLQGLPEGIADVDVRPAVNSGYAWPIEKDIYLTLGENKTNIDFMLKPGFLVSGYVKNTLGVGIPNIDVNSDSALYGCRVETDSNGYYEMRLPAGTYGMGIDNDNGQYVALPQILTITGNTSNVNFTVYDNTTGATITGNIANSGSYSVTSEFGVIAFPAGTTIDIDTLSLNNGVSLDSVPPTGGAYSLLVPPAQNYDIYFFTDSETGIESVTVRGSLLNVPAGSTGQNFTYTSVGGTINGTANYYGAPVLMSEVILTDSLGNFAGFADTDQNGTYSFYNVPAGNYVLQATAHEYGKSVKYDVSDVLDGLVESRYIEFVTPIIVTGDLDNNGQDEVIIDFGNPYGIWIYYNNSNWTQLHNISPEFMDVEDVDGNGKDDIVIDFGNPYGIWIYYNNSTWMQLHSISPEYIFVNDIDADPEGKEDIVIDFGDPYGIWIYYNNSTWTQLHNLSPEFIRIDDIDGIAGQDVIIDFGPPYGIWIYYNNSTWTQLHNISPEWIETTDLDGNGKDDIIIDFGNPYGIWIYYNNSTWTKLHNLSPDSIVAGNLDGNNYDDLIIDFGYPYGIWIYYNNSSWTHLHNITPEFMTTGNIDGDAGNQDDIIIDFGDPYGIWTYYNNSSWNKLHNLSP